MNNNEDNEAISHVSDKKQSLKYWEGWRDLLASSCNLPTVSRSIHLACQVVKEGHCLIPFASHLPRFCAINTAEWIASLYVFTGNTPSLSFFINVKRHFQPCRGQTALPSGLMLSY